LVLLLGAICLLWEPTLLAAEKKGGRVDLNGASQQELEALPGVGAATAKKIIAGRPYKSVSDLEKAGVSEKTIAAIKPLVTVGKARAAEEKPAAPAAAMEKKSPAKEARESAREAKAAPAAPAGKTDLNTASQKELEDLPGVGAATAKKIIAGRPYSSVADLSRAGVPARTVEKIGPLVAVSGKASGQAASSSSAPAPGPAPAARKAGVSAPAASSVEPAQPAPVRGMVWVNTDTKVFHREGDRWYGNTKHGKYMTEADATAAGYRESKQKTKAQ
jgi:DNA uptake protein ComE-like DNA-binding protein